jgi:hypothetical protein
MGFAVHLTNNQYWVSRHFQEITYLVKCWATHIPTGRCRYWFVVRPLYVYHIRWERFGLTTWGACIPHITEGKMNWMWFLREAAFLNLGTDSSRTIQKLPKSLNTIWLAFQVRWEYREVLPNASWSSRAQYHNILRSMMLSSECYKMIPFNLYNVEAAGTRRLVSKMIPVPLEPHPPSLVIKNVYIMWFSSINVLSPIHLNQSFKPK